MKEFLSLLYNCIIYYPHNNFKKIFIFLILLLNFKSIQPLNNFKAIFSAYSSYYIITAKNISFYNEGYGNNNFLYFNKYNFSGEQEIKTDEETEMISFGSFRDNPNNIPSLIIIKHFLYLYKTIYISLIYAFIKKIY